MLDLFRQSLSYIWGKETPINNMNQVDAIHRLIENPEANEKDIDSLLVRAERAWNGVQTFLSKIKLTIWILFWDKHSVRLIEACQKLKNITKKVVEVAENILPVVEERESDDDERINSEIITHIGHEIAILKIRLKQFDRKNGNRFTLENEVNKCDKGIQYRLENIPLINEFDEKSLLLFEIQDKISKQKIVKGPVLQKLKSLSEAGRKKAQVQETALKELEERAWVLEGEVQAIRKVMNDNYLGYYFGNELKDLTIDEMRARKQALLDLLDQRKKIEDELKQKEMQVSLV